MDSFITFLLSHLSTSLLYLSSFLILKINITAISKDNPAANNTFTVVNSIILSSLLVDLISARMETPFSTFPFQLFNEMPKLFPASRIFFGLIQAPPMVFLKFRSCLSLGQRHVFPRHLSLVFASRKVEVPQFSYMWDPTPKSCNLESHPAIFRSRRLS